MKRQTEEVGVKFVIKDYLELRGFFSWPVLQGIASYKGAPDRLLHFNGAVHYLEIKSPKGILSPNQENFRERCLRDNIPYHIIRSLEDIQAVVG